MDNRIKHAKTLVWVSLLAALLSDFALATNAFPEAIGYVMRVEGPAYVSARNRTLVATSGQAILNGSKLETGPQGALGVSLVDGTVIALGAQSELRLEDFNFDPAHKALLLQARLDHGLLSLLVGDIAKLDPKALRLQLPQGAVRIADGSHVLVKAIE